MLVIIGDILPNFEDSFVIILFYPDHNLILTVYAEIPIVWPSSIYQISISLSCIISLSRLMLVIPMVLA